MTDPTPAPLSAEALGALFTRSDGQYLCARWGRPIVPVVFGVEPETIATLKGALEAMVHLAGHRMAEHDPELGANLMFFFFRDWDELLAVPDLGRLIGDPAALPGLVARLGAQGANQYRLFRFDPVGAIRAAFVFLRMDSHLATLPAAEIALAQAAEVMLSWSDRAFAAVSPLARIEGTAVLRPEIAAVIRAAYDPVLPAAARDASHALRLSARLARQGDTG